MSAPRPLGEVLRASPAYQRLLERFPPLPPDGEPPACAACRDRRFVRLDPRAADGRPDLEHPSFGRVVPCPRCEAPRLTQARLERLFGELPGSRDWTLPSCAAHWHRCRAGGAELEPPDLPERLEGWLADEGAWLWLYGPVGLMKTAFGTALARAAIESGRSVAYRTVPRLMDRITATYRPGAAETAEDLYAALAESSLLFLDDLGREPISEHSGRVLFRLINDRYAAAARGEDRRVIVTSNLDWREVVARYDDAAWVDRLRERTGSRWLINVSGPSLRTLETA